MYRIAVCDDNPEILTQVCTTLSGSPLGKELELTPFHSGAALAAALRSGARFALLILDIELDTVDGVAIGRLLREELRDSVTQLLYISGQQQYAMALFDTRPLNFLLKPLDEAKLLDCVVQAIRLSRPEEAVLTVLVERTPRAVTIHELELLEQLSSGDYRLRIRCSKGTYIRILCHDIGQALGCGGCMAALRRTMAAGYTLAESHTIDEVQSQGESLLRPVDTLFRQYPAFHISHSRVEQLCRNGNPFTVKAPQADGLYRVYGMEGDFLCLSRLENGQMTSVKNFFGA